VEETADDALLAGIAKGEGDRLDFKVGFDPALTGDWCEFIKDVIAMAGGAYLADGEKAAPEPAFMAARRVTSVGMPA
jgi:hypothetical protein